MPCKKVEVLRQAHTCLFGTVLALMLGVRVRIAEGPGASKRTGYLGVPTASR